MQNSSVVLHARLTVTLFLAALLCAGLFPLFIMPAPHACHSGDKEATGNRCAIPPDKAASPEWAEFRWLPAGASPRQRPLTELERSFANRFPGHIARFADGRHAWVVRVMDRPTRMLHPAVDCFRGLGYKVGTPRVRPDTQGRNWRCFAAEKNSLRLRVCERIFDAAEGSWTDTSAWYWAALFKGEEGPWWAVTEVTRSEE